MDRRCGNSGMSAKQLRRVPVRSVSAVTGGFTLVELLVVIAIIGVLMGLLLPAVQMAREAARRMTCNNHQRQLALAVLNYESARQKFPVNQIGPGAPRPDGLRQAGFYSWLVPLLPFLEQENVYDRFDRTQNNGDGSGFAISASHPNAFAASTRIPLFLCPSDTPGDNTVMGSSNPASSSYAGNAGWPSHATGFEGERRVPGRHNGAIPLLRPASPVAWHGGSQVRMADFLDGTSNTALISERLIQTGNNLAAIRNGDRRLRSMHIVERDRTLPQIMAQFAGSHVDAFESAFIGRSWSSGYTLTAPTYMHVNTPNTLTGHYGSSGSQGNYLIVTSSRHPGGVNLTLADGSTRFVADDVEATVWWALGGRDDRRPETLSQ